MAPSHEAGEPIRMAVASVSGLLAWVAKHQWCGTGRLGPEHARQCVRHAVAVVFAV